MDEGLVALCDHIKSGLLVQTTEPEEQELYYELNKYKSRILQLFDVGSRNSQEAKSIENKKYTHNGKEHIIQDSKIQPILFIADQLDCSEYHCAALLTKAERRHPNYDLIQLTENAVELFYAERALLVECLMNILEVSSQSFVPSNSLRVMLTNFATEIVESVVELGGGKKGRFPEKIMLEIDRSIESSKKVMNALLNATSTTNIGSSNVATLSHNILQMRLECLLSERRRLGTLLFVIASTFSLVGSEILKMSSRLAEKPQDDVTYYILVSTLKSLNSAAPNQPSGLHKDKTFVGEFLKLLNDKTRWKSLPLRGVILLQWSVMIWFTRHHDEDLVEATDLPQGFSDEEVEKYVWDAVQSDVFKFLSNLVLTIRPQGCIDEADKSFTNLRFGLNIEGESSDININDEGFKLVLLEAFETLVTDFIKSMSSIIRRIKHRQEDVILASSRTNRSMREEQPTPTPRNDVAQLFEFIGILYTCLPPDRGLRFWSTASESGDGKLFAFLRWATESRDQKLISAGYDMLSGIAKGRTSSEVAYNFLIANGTNDRTRGGMFAGGSGSMFSWSTLFNALTWWAEVLPGSHMQHHPHLASSASGRWQQPVLSDAEAIMLSSFLRLLRVIVKYAPAARIALYTMPEFRVLVTLFALLQQGIQLELKGVIMDALAAFCEPGAGVQGVEICRTVWAALERAELINLRVGGGLAIRGVENELEGVESPAQRYPATIPFLRLLSALIHTPKDLRPQQVLIDYESIDTIPEGLGQPARFGGISPYVRFVIDSVLLRAKSREYHDPSDKWRMVEGALCFVERCLANYNLDALLSIDESAMGKNIELLRSLQSHPAFDILIQLLTDSPLRQEITEYIQFGIKALESKSIKNIYFERVLLRVLRIIQSVLDVQSIFTEILLPSLVHFEGLASDATFLSSSIVPLDQYFDWTPGLIINIALCATYADLEESKLLSIKIITQLSESTVFMATEQIGPSNRRKLNRLALILERSEESLIIQDSFMVLLIRNVSDKNIPSNELVQLSTGASAPLSDISLDLTQAIQIAILDLMLQNTVSDKSAPNIAHLLLGFSVDTTHPNQLALQDPQAANSRQTCLHAILDMLNTGIPRTTDSNASHGSPTFLLSNPSSAEKCYRLIYQLCEHRATSVVMMRYLRTREDFFPRHLSILPLIVLSEPQGAMGEVSYQDGSHVKTTIDKFVPFLRVRAWIMESTALEIHMLTEMGQTQRTAKLLSLLFGSSVPHGDDSLVNSLLNPFSAGQSLIRIIELFQSLDIEWQDNLTVEQDFHLSLFAGLDVSSCLQVDEAGCETFDINALLGVMQEARGRIQPQGNVNVLKMHEQLRKEMNHILTSCTIENNRRRVQHVRNMNYGSWKRLLDIALSKGFFYLSSDRRESILFDLLQLILPMISTVEELTAISLSELILTLVTKLRSDREQQLIFHSTFDNAHVSALPTDRLKTLLKSLISCLGTSGKVELIRGNLCASLINYFHLVQDSSEDVGSENQPSSSHSDMETIGPFTSTRPRSKRSDLESSVLSILNQDLEGIVSFISADAIDGTEVWKTVSFTLLNSLICVSRLEKQHRVLNVLSRKGFLQNFVQSIKDSDGDLQQVLRPDPENLNALYVYEVKMALLIRIAQTHSGAEKLLDCRILHVLSHCDFIEARPEGDQSFLDYDSFLPSAVYRYHQLVLPALALINSLVATLGKSSRVPEQILRFLLSHRETFIILIRENALNPGLQQIKELHLLVSACSFVTSLIHTPDLKNPASGFGGIHSAILALAARCLSMKRWHACQPAIDTERVEASTKALGYGRNVSVFDLKLEDTVDLFYEGLWTYLESASDHQVDGVFIPVFTPIAVNNRPVETSHQMTASAPTISDAVEALGQVVSDLTKVSNEVADIAAKLASREQLALEEVDEITQLSGMKYKEQFNTTQRRLLALNELQKTLTSRVNIAKRRLYSLEILLLLLWRHLDYYTKNVIKPMDALPHADKFTASSVRRSVIGEDALVSLVEHLRRMLRPVLERLDTLSLASMIVDNDHREKEVFIKMMCRLIQNCISEETAVEVPRVDDVRSLGSW